MRYGVLTILALWTIHPSLGQDIKKIVLVSQESDEPPTKPTPAKYSITFELSSDEHYIATHIKMHQKKRKLPEVAKIEKERIDRIDEWDSVKKVNLTMLDLGIDPKTIESVAENSNHKLNFELPDETVLDVDSFQFCQDYKMTKCVSTGGEMISLTLLGKLRPTTRFTFESNDIGEGEFTLKEYISCYTILNDRIPDEFPHFSFFSKEKLAEVVVYYQKTVECEGYYYQEYADKNRLTGKERRMKTGWNFVE